MLHIRYSSHIAWNYSEWFLKIFFCCCFIERQYSFRVCWLCTTTDVDGGLIKWSGRSLASVHRVVLNHFITLLFALTAPSASYYLPGTRCEIETVQPLACRFSPDDSRDVGLFETLWINNVWAARLADFIETKTQEVSCGETLYVLLARPRANCSNRPRRSEWEASLLLKHC